MLKARTLLFGIGIAVISLVLALVFWRNHPLKNGSFSERESPNLSLLREPASLGTSKIPSETSTNLCRDIYRLVCQKPGITRDPTGSVNPDLEGEKHALQIYKDIIHQHTSWDVEKVDEELVEQIFDPQRRGRIIAAARWVKQALENFIDRQPPSVFNSQEKRQLKFRLRKTQLEIPPPASIYADEPDLLTRNDVYYERTLDGTMRLRIGGAYVFIAKSWFNLVFTLAHEWAHSIDPCEVRSVGLSFPAYDRLTACFLQNGLIATHRTRSECGENDQLSETFADWLAVQMTADALTTFSTEFHGSQIVTAATNSVRDLCEQAGDVELDILSHPSPQIRIEGIFGSNPMIRELLGCGPPAPTDHHAGYCTFESIPAREVL